MEHIRTKAYFFTLLLMTAALMACSSDPKYTELPMTADPQVELDRVATNMAQAQSHQVDMLAPTNFESAKASWDKAVAGRAANKDQRDILRNIAISQAYLDNATRVSNVAAQLLPGPIEARKDALEANAIKYFPKETSKADHQFKRIGKQIEENDTSGAEAQRAGLEAEYRDLELKSIKKEKLGPAQANIDEAIKEGAKKLAPQTLSWAKQHLADDEKTIETQRHNTTEINRASEDAIESANRLVRIVREAKNSSSKKAEDLAKQVESNEQAALMAEKELARTESQLAEAQNKLAATAAKNSALESQTIIDKKFEAARAQFTNDEAEVYKQGDKLLLRLKGLSFAPNKAVIDTNNYPLLSKVQKVIKEIGTSQVAIEGHTDSIGDKKLNEDLSTKRAESVQTYLISNQTVPVGKISATGLGDSKPIATNKTASGRAQNRRVDIIITGETTRQ